MSQLGKIVYPEVFKAKYIMTHWDFENDLKDVLERSGQKNDFIGKYKQRLRFLDDRRDKCILKHDWFEELKQADGLYSIKFNNTQKNIRIIFTFIEYNEHKYALLLSAFAEKDKKKMSQYSYRKHIPLAQRRLREVIEND
ncbi:MAG: hypothetical protein PHU36_07155 [Syntrophomonadaceae bacterium]|nr:hypothetical protein [Syntrophomonadaceae bacterium]